MRQFDYTTVPAELEATPITNLLLSIREHKGRQLVLSQVKPELLSSLMEEAKIQSAQSSNGLEGIVTTQKRIRTTLKKGGLLLGYNPRAPGSRLKARARTSSRPSAS